MININLTGRTAVVTGATGELGRYMVRTLGEAGADVAICYYKSEDKANGLLDELRAKGIRCAAAQGDITDEKEVFAIRDKITDALGPPDIIVNNAIIQYDWKHLLDQSPKDYESQFRSCVLHNVLMAQAFVPAMIEKGWGRVIGINSECAMQCHETQSAYISGKRGMDGALRVLAREVGGHGITVNQVAPGWTVSENRPATGSELEKNYTEKVPLKRRGVEQEIANVVTFLASDLASYITGAYIPVCGGNVMPAI